MSSSFLRSLLALGALISMTTLATAQQRGFRRAVDPWSGAPTMATAHLEVQPVAYATDSEPSDEMPTPPDAGNVSSGQRGSCDDRSSRRDCQDDCDSNSCDCEPDDGRCAYDGGPLDGCPCDNHYDGCSCGSYPCDCGSYCGDCYGSGDYCGSPTSAGMYYAEIQNIFLRPHVSSEVIGKLREKHEYSPRIVLGYEAPGGLGARVRYWNYARTTTTLDNTSSLRIDFDVLDIEGTTRFSSKRADLVLSGGFRWADLYLAEDVTDPLRSEMPGITFAADVRGTICGNCHSQWSAVSGARWSLLGGDWEGDTGNLMDSTFDDNLEIQEIYGGVEFLSHYRGCDFYTRLVFEVQNWHSDALGENSATDSIGFIGPAIHGGISF